MIPIKEAQLTKQQQERQPSATLDESKYSNHYYHCTQNNRAELQLDHNVINASGSSSNNNDQKVVLPAAVVGTATALQVAPILPSQSAACELDTTSSASEAAVAMANNNSEHDRSGSDANEDNNFNNNHSGSRYQIQNKKPESWCEEPERASLVGVSDCNNARTLQQIDALTSLFAHVDKVRKEVDQLIVGSKEAVAETASSADEQQEGRQQTKRALKLLGINSAPNLNSPIVNVNKLAFIKQHQTEPSTMSAAPGLLGVGSVQAAAAEESVGQADLLQFSTAGSSNDVSQQSMPAESASNENFARFVRGFSDETVHKQQENANTLLIIQHLVQRRNELKTIDKQLFVMMRQHLMQLDCFQQAAINNYIWPGAEFSTHLDFNSNNTQVSLSSHSLQQQLVPMKAASKSSQQQEPTWLYQQNNSQLSLIGNSHYNYLASLCGIQPELADVIDLSLGRENQRFNYTHQLPLELVSQQQHHQSQEPLRSASLDSSRTSSSLGKASSPSSITNVPARETRAPSVNPRKTRLLGANRQAINEHHHHHQQQLELNSRQATNEEVSQCQQQQKQSGNLSTCSFSHPLIKPDQTSQMDLLEKQSEDNNNQNSGHNGLDGRKNGELQFGLQLQQQLIVATADGIDEARCSTFDSTTMSVASEQVRSSGLTTSNDSPLPSLHVVMSDLQQKLTMTSADKATDASSDDVVADHDDDNADADAGPARKKFRSWPQVSFEQQQRIDLGSQQAGKPSAIISDSIANSLETDNVELIYSLHQQQQQHQQHLFSQYLGRHNRAGSLSPMHLLSIRGVPSDTNFLINDGRLGDQAQFNSEATSADYRTNSTAAMATTNACLLFDRHDDSLACAQNPPFRNHHLHHQSTVASGLHSTTTSIAPAHRIAVTQAGHHHHQHAFAPPVSALIGQQLVQNRDLQRPIAYRCHVCGSGFEDRHRLQQHLSIHLNLHPSWFEERTIKETMAQYESKRGDYLCSTCNLRFDTTAEFDRHMHLHGDKPHRCEFCNQDSKLISFRYYRQLLTHLRSHCFLYSCKFAPDCKQTANRKDYLKLHILKHHLNNKLPEQYTFCCH